MPSIPLTPAEREDLFDHYRRSADPAIRLRAHILLLLDAGHPWATISVVLFCSISTISRWKRRFEDEGVDAVYGRPRAGTLIGAMVLDAGAGPAAARRYDAAWMNEEAGMSIVSDQPFDVDVSATCDLAVADRTTGSFGTTFRPSRYVRRSRLHHHLEQFLRSQEPVFVLVGRSGFGKSWTLADWSRSELAGRVRLLIHGGVVTPDATLGRIASDYFGRYTARDWTPQTILSRLAVVAREAGRGPLVFVIDDLRVSAETAEAYRDRLAGLSQEARQVGGKLVVACQLDTSRRRRK